MAQIVFSTDMIDFFFFFQAEDGIRDRNVTGVQTCALPILEKAIKELGYEVNTYARGLKTQETKLITLIVPDTINPFFAAFTQYVEKNLYEHGYKLILCCANGIPEKEIGYLNLASQSKTDGIIALTYTDVINAIPARIPLVSFDRYFENHDVPMIASDNFQGGYAGTKKLLELGCHHPVFIRFRS